MSILVTGGAGFIGSHVVDRLSALGRSSICLDNYNDYYDVAIKRANTQKFHTDDNIECIEGDIRDMDTCRNVFENYDVSAVIHLAARAGVRPSIENPMLYEEVNCKGTVNLLECAQQFNTERFIFGSSSSVYGESATAPFKEEWAADEPISPYAATKRSGELFCHTYHHLYDIPVVALRFFTVYGPRQRPDLAIHKFTRLIDNNEPIPMYGDGSSQRDYTYITDIIDGIISALDSDLQYEIINLGNSNPITLRRLIEVIANAMGTKPEINQLPDQPGDVSLTFADVTKAESLLKYNPEVSIVDGINRFVDWYRSNNRNQ